MVYTGKKVLFIINKHSGMGYQSVLEGRMLNSCEKNNIECTIEYTQSRGHATTLAQDASKNKVDFVVAVGGDGTINETAKGLLNSQTPMGIIPRGSGNGLARHLGIPVNITEAIDTLFDSQVINMDTLTINDKLSLNVSGIGFDGHVANLFAGKSIRGFFGYAKLTLKEFFKFPEFEAEITMEGKKTKQRAFIIAIANSSQYGNNVKIAPSASVCDGLLQLSIMKKVPVYRFDFIYSLLTGSLEKSRHFETLNAKTLEIRTSKAVAYHIDGEPSGLDDTFRIDLKPSSLRVLVPAKSLQGHI